MGEPTSNVAAECRSWQKALSLSSTTATVTQIATAAPKHSLVLGRVESESYWYH